MLMVTGRSNEGRTVLGSRRSGVRPQDAERRLIAQRRRFEDWLTDHHVGRPSHPGGPVRRRSAQEIADVYGVSRQAVEKGIREAEKLRGAIADAVASVYSCRV